MIKKRDFLIPFLFMIKHTNTIYKKTYLSYYRIILILILNKFYLIKLLKLYLNI